MLCRNITDVKCNLKYNQLTAFCIPFVQLEIHVLFVPDNKYHLELCSTTVTKCFACLLVKITKYITLIVGNISVD